MKEISRGAEASIREENGAIVKDRLKKGYRIETIDNRIRKTRTKTEAKIINEARRAGVPTPTIQEITENTITMEKIDGKKLKDAIPNLSESNLKEVAKTIGSYVAKLHKNNIIHGDLTTSNMILSDKLYFIDFGLSFQSSSIEDKAIDLHLLSQALQSTHLDRHEFMWQNIIEDYKKHENSEEILKRLEEIEKRGRYKKG